MTEPAPLDVAVERYAARLHAPVDTLAAADAVIEARLALYAVLVADGWIPPRHIQLARERDARLVQQSAGAFIRARESTESTPSGQ